MATYLSTWKDSNSPVTVDFIHTEDPTDEVKIITKSYDIVQSEISVPGEAMQFFAKAALMEKLSAVLEENGFI
jgi:hypothetical protein